MLKESDKLHNFTVTRVREEKELSGRLVEMTHDITGTELVWVDNGAVNKTFAITFRTFPEDSTGVFHILEHSVLCGSEKYPVKEPFVELMKSSVNTFLNALTWPDKTMYPVSSRNRQDYLNLAEVYLDAVFAPAILTNPLIFAQEGIHIETGEDGNRFNGVVYNEMKGAMSSADRVINDKLIRMLFPDTAYGVNAGGDPTCIPDLTYEKFRDTYLRFYHPTNARVFLDGAVPIEETLSLIDSYLSRYTRLKNIPALKLQVPVGSQDTNYIEVDPDEDITDKAQLSIGKIIGSWKDIPKNLAIKAMIDVLLGTNEAPLKRIILSSGLAQEVLAECDDSIAQPLFQMCFKNIRDGSRDELLKLLRDSARDLAEKGLDHEALHSSLNHAEYVLRDIDEPQGIERCCNIFYSWLYGGDPMLYLTQAKYIDEARKLIDNGECEKLLTEILCDEKLSAVLLSLPSKTLGAEKAKAEQERVDRIVAGWTDEERRANEELVQRLNEWQATPDTAENIATLPVISIDEIREPQPPVPSDIDNVNGVKVFRHNLPTGGIAHVSAYFPLSFLTIDELKQFNIFTGLLSVLPTEKYDVRTLQNCINNNIGHLSFSISSVPDVNNRSLCCPYLCARFSALDARFDDAAELMLEMLFNTIWDKEKIREFVLQDCERVKETAPMIGHALGSKAVLSAYTAVGAMSEALKGITQFNWIKELAQNFDAYADRLIALVKNTLTTAIKKQGAIIGITEESTHDLSSFIAALPDGGPAPQFVPYSIELPARSGYRIPAAVSYAEQGWNLNRTGTAYSADMRVAANIISLGLLWNEVRVKGGAYGTGFTVYRNGDMFTYSYRDPNPQGSLEANRLIADYLREFCESGECLDKYILSTISGIEPLSSSREKGESADFNIVCGYRREDYLREREKMLNTTHADLLKFCDILDSFSDKGRVCVVASADTLDKLGDITVLE